VVASLGRLLQLLCQRRLLSCKSVEGNEKANENGLQVDERRLRKVTPVEKGDIIEMKD